MKNKVLQIETVGGHASGALQVFAHSAGRWWRRVLRMTEARPRQLRLLESLPLGERRFVAVVEYNAARFLLGGTSASIVLLAQLAINQNPALSAGEQASHRANEVEH